MKNRYTARAVLCSLFFAALTTSTTAYSATGEKYFETYGFAMVDYIQDFKRVNPAWKDTLRPSKIPTTAGQFGDDGEASLSAKQTKFGIQANLPVEDKDLFTKFEFDFFGVGPDEGQTTIRLRHAYGEWGSFLAGQTNSLFMDGDIFPNVIDYWGPAGMVFFRTAQIRWSPIKGDTSLSVAIEDPGNDVDTGNVRDFDPDLAANIQPVSKLPDVTAAFKMKRDWGHIQAAGIYRTLGFETVAAGNTENNPKDTKTGWGLDLTSKVSLGANNRVLLGYVVGQGIASYMNDGGNDLAPEGTPGAGNAKAVPLQGLSAYFERSWTDSWSSAIGYAQTAVENTNAQQASAFKKGEYASVNALYAPHKNLMSGAELLWGSRTDKNDANGTDIRAQISMKYSFSSKDF